MHDLLAGRAARQRHRPAETAAPAAHMAIGAAAHGADRNQRRAIHTLRPGNGGFGAWSHAARSTRKWTGASFARQAKDAVHRAQIAAPDPLAPAEGITHGYGRKRGAAKNEKRRFGVLVNADELAIGGGAGEGDKGPSLPFHPMRYRTAPAMPAHRLRQRAFRAEHAAPQTPDKDHAQENERPPDAPEDELGEKREIGPDMRGALRRRQKRRNDDQKCIGGDDNPLHGQDRPLMPHKPIARSGQKAIDAVCRGPYQAAFAIRSLVGADEKINHRTIIQSSERAVCFMAG